MKRLMLEAIGDSNARLDDIRLRAVCLKIGILMLSLPASASRFTADGGNWAQRMSARSVPTIYCGSWLFSQPVKVSVLYSPPDRPSSASPRRKVEASLILLQATNALVETEEKDLTMVRACPSCKWWIVYSKRATCRLACLWINGRLKGNLPRERCASSAIWHRFSRGQGVRCGLLTLRALTRCGRMDHEARMKALPRGLSRVSVRQQSRRACQARVSDGAAK